MLMGHSASECQRQDPDLWVVWETRASFVYVSTIPEPLVPNKAIVVLGFCGRESEAPLSELAASRLRSSG
jgi:hypothetical protein